MRNHTAVLQNLILRLLVVFAGLFVSGNVYAACANPAGIQGSIIYSVTYNQPAWCDGNNWNTFLGNSTGSSATATVTPYGASGDVQINSSGALGGDTGNFTYASGVLTAPTVSGTYHYGQYASFTTIYNPGSFSGNTAALNSVSSTLVSASTISGTLIQLGNSGASCTAGLAGAQRYNSVSNTIDYCTGSAWMSLGPSATVPVAFLVTRNGVDQSITTSVDTKVDWTTKAFDTNSNFDLSTDRFTPTIPGYYVLSLKLAIANGSPALTYGFIRKNGAVIGSSVDTYSNGSHSVTIISYANGSTDYFDAYTYQAMGSTVGLSGVSTFSYFTGSILGPQAGGGGGSANPAGSSNDVQFNSSGLLAADTGKFTYTSGVLAAPTVSATALNGQYGSITTLYNPGSFSGNTVSANGVSSTLVSASVISTTYIQMQSATTVLACGSNLAGAMRYTSGTMQVCDGSGWTNIGLGIPQGTISAFSLTSCPNGWSEYTAARGRFLRGIDNGAGVDPSGTRSPGNQQADAFQGHNHELYVTANLVASGGGNGFRTNASTVANTGPFSNYVRNPLTDGVNGTPRTANETRPVNVAVIFCQYQGFQSQLATGVATLASLSDVSVAGASNGQVLTYSGGAWIASTTSAGSGVTGGTANYGAIFSGPTTLTTDSALYIDRTNHRLGIGTSAVSATLTVSGGVMLGVSNTFYQPNGQTLQISSGANGSSRLILDSSVSGQAPFYAAASGNDLAFGKYDISAMRIMTLVSNGAVGIGIASPTAKLDVAGTVSASDAIQVGSSSLTCAAGLNGSIRYNSVSGTLQICTGTVWTSLASGTTGGGGTPAGSTGDIQFNTSGAFDADTGNLFWDKTNDRLGLGLSSPAQTLDVSGTVRVKTASNVKLTLDTPATSQQGTIGFASVGTNKWLLGKATDDSFFMYDSPASRYVMNIYPSGNMALMANGGNVGIGTSTPSYPLEVVGTSNLMMLSGYTSTTTAIGYLSRASRGTSASPLPTLTGDRMSFLIGATYGGSTWVNNAALNMFASEDQTESARGSYLTLETTGASTTTRVERMRVTAAGNVGIGTTAPSTPLEVSGSQAFRISQVGGTNNPYMEWTRSGVRQAYMGWGAPGSAFNISMENNNALYINASSTTVSGNLTAVAFLYSSDKRLKSDIHTLTGGLAKLDELNPVSFRFTADPSKTTHLGLIAQDVQKVYPEAVKTDEKGFLKLDYPALVGPMVGMLKELKSAILADHGELEAAKVEIRELKAANDKLNAANDNMRVRMDELERSVRAIAR